jgi:hypothetical protein
VCVLATGTTRCLHEAQNRLILAALGVVAYSFASVGGTVEGDLHELAAYLRLRGRAVS